MFEQKKSIFGAIFKFLFGVIFLVLFLWGANYLAKIITNASYLSFVNLFNENLFILIAISSIFLLGDLLLLFSKPFDLMAPAFKATASALLVSFIFKLFYLVDSSIGSNLSRALDLIYRPVYIIVIITVLLTGYVYLLMKYRANSKLAEQVSKLVPRVNKEELKREIKKEMEEEKEIKRKAKEKAKKSRRQKKDKRKKK